MSYTEFHITAVGKNKKQKKKAGITVLLCSFL